eukprot:1753084-Prymnesium_polylepis.1
MDDVRLGETDAIGEGKVLLDMTAARSTPHGIEPVRARRRRQEQEPRLSSDSLVRLDTTSDHRQGETPDLGCGREVQTGRGAPKRRTRAFACCSGPSDG